MNKKQFFLSMSKKQLISSLTVTGMMMGSMACNAFADSNNIASDTINTSDISVASDSDVNISGNSDVNISGNSKLNVPDESELLYEQGGIKHTPETIRATVANIENKNVTVPDRQNDRFTVRINKLGNLENGKYADYSVKAKVSTARNGLPQVHFTVITTNGATLGELENSQSLLDGKEVYKNGTTVYRFHYTCYGGGHRVININIKPVVEVSDTNTLVDLLNKTNSKNPKTIKLTQDIVLDDGNLSQVGNGNKELAISNNGVSIDGNGYSIDFQDKGSLTLKGNDITLSDIKIANSRVQVYNSKNVTLKNVTVEKSEGFGIFVNGSTVNLEGCTTKNNKEGGILISRSRTLTGSNCTDSILRVIGSLTQEEESNQEVVVKNLEMPNDGSMQRNSFIPVNVTYTNASIKVDYKPLSKFYCEQLGIPNNKTFREETIIYNNQEKQVQSPAPALVLEEVAPVQEVQEQQQNNNN